MALLSLSAVLDWQRTATQDSSAGKTIAALSAYDKHHNIIAVETRDDARKALIARWAHDHRQDPNANLVEPDGQGLGNP